MTHTQWNAQIKRALAISEKNPDAAVRLLERLARTITSETGTGLQQWHPAQTLGVTSSVQSESGKHRQAADTMLRVAEHHEQDLRYHQRALVSAFAVSAMELAQGGDLRGAPRCSRGPSRLRVRCGQKRSCCSMRRKPFAPCREAYDRRSRTHKINRSRSRWILSTDHKFKRSRDQRLCFLKYSTCQVNTFLLCSSSVDAKTCVPSFLLTK
jgi:hypothetical protein